MTGGAKTVPAFITGCGRSGTTLLRAMLDAHPELAVPPESYFVVALLKQREVFEPGGTLDRAALETELAAAPSFREWQLPVSDLADHEAFAAADDVPAALAAAYEAYAHRAGKRRAVDKTPFQGPNIELIAASFPGARFIHLVRDGRNVAQSLASMDFGPDRLDGAIQEWRRHVDAIDDYARDRGDEVLTVRYEDLVAEPTAVLTAICDHLGLPFDQAMLDYPQRADELLAPMARTAHLEGVRQAPRAERRDWTALDPDLVAVLEELAADTLARHGYQRSSDGLGPTGQVRRLWATLLYRLRAARLGLGARRARHLRARRLDRRPSAV